MSKQRVLYYDVLNIMACFAVIMLHCNALVWGFTPTFEWTSSLLVEVLFYWAVPIFLMLTGANNMRYRDKYSTKEFLGRRLKKLIIPFVFWSLFIYLFKGFYFGTLDALTLHDFMNGFFGNQIEPIYWFFFCIISITLAMPVYSQLSDKREVLWYMVIVAFCLQFCMPFVMQGLHISWNGDICMLVLPGYTLYVILGFLLSTESVSKKCRHTIYGLAVVSWAIRFGWTYRCSFIDGFTNTTFFTLAAFTALFPAVAVFLFVQNVDWTKTVFLKKPTLIQKLASCSFGIYLIHKLILDIFLIDFCGIAFDSFFLRFVAPFLLYAISLAIVLLLKKNKMTKYLVP